MNVEFKVNKVAGRVDYKENGVTKEAYLDLANIMYLLSTGYQSRFLKIMYAILVSGIEYGFVKENYVVVPGN